MSSTPAGTPDWQVHPDIAPVPGDNLIKAAEVTFQ